MSEPDQDFVGILDLIDRWKHYTPRGVRKLAHRADFPTPDHTVNRGKDAVWFLPEIKFFEATHPELKSEAAKRRKVAGFAIGILAKQKRQGGQ
jgi:hypothetical protein